MGFRFRKSFRVIPGVRVNLTTRGVSTTLGPRGFSVNVSPRGAHLNVGIPGTGLTSRHRLAARVPAAPPEVEEPSPPDLPGPGDPALVGATEIASGPIARLSDEGTAVLQQLITEAVEQRSSAVADTLDTAALLKKATRRLARARWPIVRWFLAKRVPNLEAALATAQADHDEAERRLEGASVDVDFEMTAAAQTRYADLTSAFEALTRAMAIWDVTSTRDIDRQRTRSAASEEVSRRPVTIGTTTLPIVKSRYPAMRFGNANGEEFHILPSVVIVGRPNATFAILDLRALSLEYGHTLFVEHSAVPADAELAEYTWEKVNRNGQPDRRFKENRQIPVMRYGRIAWSSTTGINEEYLASSGAAVEAFGRAFVAYQMELPPIARG